MKGIILLFIVFHVYYFVIDEWSSMSSYHRPILNHQDAVAARGAKGTSKTCVVFTESTSCQCLFVKISQCRLKESSELFWGLLLLFQRCAWLGHNTTDYKQHHRNEKRKHVFVNVRAKVTRTINFFNIVASLIVSFLKHHREYITTPRARK